MQEERTPLLLLPRRPGRPNGQQPVDQAPEHGHALLSCNKQAAAGEHEPVGACPGSLPLHGPAPVDDDAGAGAGAGAGDGLFHLPHC